MHLSLKRYRRHLLDVVLVVFVVVGLCFLAAFFISASIDKRQAAKFQAVVPYRQSYLDTQNAMPKILYRKSERLGAGVVAVEWLLQFNYPKVKAKAETQLKNVKRTAPHRTVT